MPDNQQQEKMLDGGVMHRQNWVLVLSGLAVFFSGFFVLALVGKEHHGFRGFLAPFLLVAGLVVLAAGFIHHRNPEGRKR